MHRIYGTIALLSFTSVHDLCFSRVRPVQVAVVLRTIGPRALWLTLPERVMINRNKFQSRAQNLVQSWCAAVVDARTADAPVLKRLASGLLDIVHLLSPGSSIPELEAITAEWVQMFFYNVAGELNVNEERLMSFLSSAQQPQADTASVDPRAKLLGMGLKATANIPQNAFPSLCEALLVDGASCPLSFEDFVDTTTGRLSPGLSVVIREDGGRFHCFVYSTQEIVSWIETSQTDPMTRENLSIRDLIEIT